MERYETIWNDMERYGTKWNDMKLERSGTIVERSGKEVMNDRYCII
jgi:hypothetical protein